MNRVLFEVSYIGSFRGFLNIILAFCIFFFLYLRFSGISGVLQKALIVLMVVYTISLIKGYVDTVIQYKNGNYIEIEGTVERYYYSQGNEYFTLDGVSFRCSSGISWGYYPNNSNDSVIAGNGQHLRIRYLPNKSEKVIVYIEQLMTKEKE